MNGIGKFLERDCPVLHISLRATLERVEESRWKQEPMVRQLCLLRQKAGYCGPGLSCGFGAKGLGLDTGT